MEIHLYLCLEEKMLIIFRKKDWVLWHVGTARIGITGSNPVFGDLCMTALPAFVYVFQK
jgi:hypothetical protein